MSLQTMNSLDSPSNLEKFLRRFLPLAILGGVGFYFWGSISSFVARTVWDTWTIIKYGTLPALVGLFWWQYPEFVSMTWKSICKGIASLFIRMDPLSYMDRYADILSNKLKNLNKAIVGIKAELIQSEADITADEEAVKQNLKLAAAAKQEGKIQAAASYGLEARNAQESIKLATPGKIKLEKSLQFMSAMSENWEYSIKGIKSFNERKRRDYKRLKKNAAALKQSEEFLSGNTPEAQIYKESIKAAESQMAQWLAYANDFEEKAKPILEGAAIEKRMNTNEGLSMLEEYMKDGKLMLPDFNNLQTVGFTNKLQAEELPYEDQQNKRFDL